MIVKVQKALTLAATHCYEAMQNAKQNNIAVAGGVYKQIIDAVNGKYGL